MPKSFLDEPEEFGKVDSPAYRSPTSVEEAGQLIASVAQHRASFVIRTHRNAGLSVRDLAERIGTDEGYLSGQLTGRYPAGFDDIARWSVAVRDVTVLPAFDSLDGMQPTDA